MIAITTNSSTSVNPTRFAGEFSPCLGGVSIMINVTEQNKFGTTLTMRKPTLVYLVEPLELPPRSDLPLKLVQEE